MEKAYYKYIEYKCKGMDIMESSIHTIACNHLLILFAVVTMTGIICSKLSDILKIPDVVLFLIAGIFIGPSVLKLLILANIKSKINLYLHLDQLYIIYGW